MPGKMSERRRRFTLIEIMAVIVILGILATVLIRNVTNQVRKARRTAATTKIVWLQNAVQMFSMDNNRYPNSLGGMVVKPADVKRWPRQGYLDGLRSVPKDPWGNDYFYKMPGPDEREYIVGSYAKDGKEGGEDWDEDLDCWKIQENPD